MKSLLRINQLQSGRLVPIFFLSLCIFSFVMAVVLNNKEVQNLAKPKEVARFEIFDFEYYRIGTQGVSVVAFGKRARENAQKLNELEHFSIVNFTFPNEKAKEGVQENLQSSFALYDNQEIFFPQGELDRLKNMLKQISARRDKYTIQDIDQIGRAHV